MATRTTETTNTDDLIDIRDVIARVEALMPLHDNNDDGTEDACSDGDEHEELTSLLLLLEECKGNGGDEQWRGDWYPITLIRDSYFEEYAQELAEDIGAIQSGMSWPYTCIDWEQAARELQTDYTAVEFGDVT